MLTVRARPFCHVGPVRAVGLLLTRTRSQGPREYQAASRGLCMAGTVRLLLRVTGFKNARDVAKVWVHTEGATWYTDDDAWYVANHDIDPDTNSLVTYVDGVPSGSEGAPCAGN